MGLVKSIINNYIDSKYKTIDDLPSNVIINVSDKKRLKKQKY